MMLTVELKRISGTPVWLLVLCKGVSHWLARVHNIYHHITNIAQKTHHCEITMQDFVAYINSQLTQGQYSLQCVVNIDETNIFFDIESGLTLLIRVTQQCLWRQQEPHRGVLCCLGLLWMVRSSLLLYFLRDTQMGGLSGLSMGCQHPWSMFARRRLE